MKVPVIDSAKKEIGKIELPEQFKEEFRPDIIQRAVIAVQSSMRQPYGAYPMAGKQASAVISRRRRDYRGSYGLGISRVPRKIVSRRGSRMNWIGAFAPGTVGGRRAHPPKAEKILLVKVNKKERRKAIRSALAATMNKDIVRQRGHLLPEDFPFVVDSAFQDISKANEFQKAVLTLGLEREFLRNATKKIRAGRGKSRGRKYKKNRGMLFVVSKECGLYNKCSNLPGIEIEIVTNLNAEKLAPGTNPGRLTIFTKAAIERLGSERLFTEDHAGKPSVGGPASEKKAAKAAKPMPLKSQQAKPAKVKAQKMAKPAAKSE